MLLVNAGMIRKYQQVELDLLQDLNPTAAFFMNNCLFSEKGRTHFLYQAYDGSLNADLQNLSWAISLMIFLLLPTAVTQQASEINRHGMTFPYLL